jgi:hypothetical protein
LEDPDDGIPIEVIKKAESLSEASDHPGPGSGGEDSRTESPESGADLQGESAEGGEKPGGEDVGADAASHDLREAQIVVEVILKDLAGADGGELVREARTEVESLYQLLGLVSGQLKKGGTSANLVVSVIVHVEMTRKAVQEAADRADGKLKEILKGALRKLGKVGDKLLSMSLHLFPVREWSLAGEVSALFVKGSISVTFGK